MNEDFRSVASQLSRLNASSMAWAQLHSLNKSMEDIAVSVHAHSILPRIFVIDVIKIMHSPAPYPNLNHHN